MKSGGSSFMIILLTIVAQAIINTYLNIAAYLSLSILPLALILIPTRYSTSRTLFIAFAMGFVVDMLSSGVIGMSAAAILPAAGLRKAVIHAICGEEILERGDDINLKKLGWGKISTMLLAMAILFFAVYTPLEAAGMRSITFILIKAGISIAASFVLSCILFSVLANEHKSEPWK